MTSQPLRLSRWRPQAGGHYTTKSIKESRMKSKRPKTYLKAGVSMLVNAMVAASILLGASAAYADAVTDWNAIRQTTVASANSYFQGRSSAIVQLAVFEAVNSI